MILKYPKIRKYLITSNTQQLVISNLDLITQNVEIYDHLENAAACPCKTLLEQRNRGNALRKAIFLKTSQIFIDMCSIIDYC